ncbi:conserved hypothetical protein [Gammaproteobacteria bacterium]
MILDAKLRLSTAQAFTNTSKASEDHINQGAAGDAVGNEMYFVVRVKDAFTSGTSLQFSLQCHDDASFGAPKTLAMSPVFLPADLTENNIVWAVRIPKGCEQFIRGYGTVVGTFDAGTVDMFLASEIEVRG